MFEDSTFESTGRIRTRSRRWMLVTFALNGLVLLALILIPLIYPEALPGRLMSILLTVPPPPPAPTQPPKQEASHPFHGERQLTDLGLTAPTRIPTTIAKFQGSEAAPGGQLSMDQGGPGIPGGDLFRSTSPATVHPGPRPTGPTHISSGVAAGLLIQKALPQYPPLGKAVRVEGTVVLQAVISKSGTIENLRVVSGHPMLQQAAIDAVRQWRYRPYMLDGEPVEVETTINVIFSLSH
jgi:protein TonB